MHTKVWMLCSRHRHYRLGVWLKTSCEVCHILSYPLVRATVISGGPGMENPTVRQGSGQFAQFKLSAAEGRRCGRADYSSPFPYHMAERYV